MGLYDEAECIDADPDLFFPTKHSGVGYSQARKICAACPVTEECLAMALRTEPPGKGHRIGMFGGLSPDERERLVNRARKCIVCGRTFRSSVGAKLCSDDCVRERRAQQAREARKVSA